MRSRQSRLEDVGWQSPWLEDFAHDVQIDMQVIAAFFATDIRPDGFSNLIAWQPKREQQQNISRPSGQGHGLSEQAHAKAAEQFDLEHRNFSMTHL